MAANLERVRRRIADAAGKAGRGPEEVCLVAVAKTADAAGLAAAWAAGQQDFGHNRVQWLERDRNRLPQARWHAIGPLQGNKVRRAVAAADLIHAVGEATTARRIARAAAALERPRVPLLAQVNLQPEDGRYGCAPSGLPLLLAALASEDRLQVRGLMALGPHPAGEETLRRAYARLRALAEAAARDGLLPRKPELSMGMSDDFEIAIAEGATLVRVGRAIFSPPDASLHPAGS